MNKTDLARQISYDTGYKIKDIEVILDSFTDFAEQALARGETVRLVNFGAFVPEHKPERNGTNPKTQEKIVIQERNTVKFKPGKDLKKIMNIED